MAGTPPALQPSYSLASSRSACSWLLQGVGGGVPATLLLTGGNLGQVKCI